MFGGQGSRRESGRGDAGTKAHLLHKKSSHSPDPHAAWSGYCSRFPGEGMEAGDRQWLTSDNQHAIGFFTIKGKRKKKKGKKIY